MEVIRLSGYTEDEKTNIALKYLLPKQMKNNGVKDDELLVTEEAIRDIVRYYTREAGVRSLERELSKICRKVVKGLQLKKMKPKVTVDGGEPQRLPGRAQVHLRPRRSSRTRSGQVVGLAWTEVGGDLLTIEAALMPGKGNITTHRLAGRRDEGIDRGRAHRGAQPRAPPGHRRRRCSRRRTSTSTCPMARRPRTVRARARR